MTHIRKLFSVLLAAALLCGCLAPAFAEGEPEHEHNSWAWAITESPTCGAPGAKYEFCTICYANGVLVTRNENTPIPPTGEHTLVWVQDEAPTCGASGVQHQYCTVCQSVFDEGTVINPTGAHDWRWVVDREAFCGKTGYKHQECAVCHAVQNEFTTVPIITNHTWAWETVNPPTCGAAGTQRQYCTVCRAHDLETYQSEGSLLQPTGEHTWDAGTVSREPTCSRAGVMVYTCTVCGHQMAYDIATVPHVDANGDDKCDNCGVYCGSGTGVSFWHIVVRVQEFFADIWERLVKVFSGEYFR